MCEYNNVDDWIEHGIKMGYAEKFCYTHDASPMTNIEAIDDESGIDICIPTLRIWLD